MIRLRLAAVLCLATAAVLDHVTLASGDYTFVFLAATVLSFVALMLLWWVPRREGRQVRWPGRLVDVLLSGLAVLILLDVAGRAISTIGR